MYKVYVLRSGKDGKLYIGCTQNLQNRFAYHNSGKVRSTKGRRPLVLLYSEEYSDKTSAYKAEKRYKSAKGKRELLKKIENCRVV